jgi:hypothetical protein
MDIPRNSRKHRFETCNNSRTSFLLISGSGWYANYLQHEIAQHSTAQLSSRVDPS